MLRPGAIFAGYDWCMTPLFDSGNAEHREIKRRIEYGNALPQIASFAEITDGLQAAGFEILEARDRASDADPETPWYKPLEGRGPTLRGLLRSALGRKMTSAVLRVLEGVRAVPKEALAAQQLLNVAADNLVAGGRLGYIHAHVLPQGAQAGPLASVLTQTPAPLRREPQPQGVKANEPGGVVLAIDAAVILERSDVSVVQAVVGPPSDHGDAALV